ncbi:tryptase-2-like [Polymixia lowei]
MHVSGLLTVVLLVHATTGTFGSKVRSSIVGGQDAPDRRWPWMAHLNITNGTSQWRCGGSLLTNEWVLTSANCMDQNPDIRKSMIFLGSYKLRGPSKYFRGILYVIRHPDYYAQTTGYENDIAMIKMSKKVNFSPQVTPVKLPSAHETFGPGSECWITGWGNVGNGIPLPGKETLQQLKVPIVTQSDCEAAYGSLTTSTLCAGYLEGGKDACIGDYGGPLVCQTAHGFVQAGIMSFGNPRGCALPGFPSVYTRVSQYMTFITDTLRRNLEASAEV